MQYLNHRFRVTWNLCNFAVPNFLETPRRKILSIYKLSFDRHCKNRRIDIAGNTDGISIANWICERKYKIVTISLTYSPFVTSPRKSFPSTFYTVLAAKLRVKRWAFGMVSALCMAVSKLGSQSATWLRRYTRVPQSHESLMTTGRSGLSNSSCKLQWKWDRRPGRDAVRRYPVAHNELPRRDKLVNGSVEIS